MFTQSDKSDILREFPNIKLSYENIVYKKVYNSDYIVAIPHGKKCFVWFTTFNDKMVCLVMELANNTQIMDIKIANACFSDELSYGTIFYGTQFYNSGNKFFCIEDIFSYKGTNIDRINWGEKLMKLKDILKKDLKQVSYNKNFLVFGLPIMCKTNEELENSIRDVSYDIESVQYKLFSRTNAYIYMEYATYKSQISQTAQVLQYSRPKNDIQPMKQANHQQRQPIPSPVKRDIVFTITPDIQNDIYYIHTSNKEQHGIAHIPDYKTSVMMNKLLRIIKENDNLDALEESDDEEEFENEKIDKFVCLNKSCKMVCQFNHKFKKWTPIRLANENSNVITSDELKYIYSGYEQNKKKNYTSRK